MHNHLIFLEPSRNLESAITGFYVPEMVLLSVFIATLFSYTAFLISSHLYKIENSPRRTLWIIAGAVSLGGGVWGMHFVGMLAYKLPMAVNYDGLTTVISIIPAILASLVVVQTPRHNVSLFKSLWWRSVLMGGGIGLMHYVGMMAMNMNSIMRYDLKLFILSILVAVFLAAISLRLKIWASQHADSGKWLSPQLLIAATVMGFAISGMHYTGMTAMYIFPGDSLQIKDLSWSPTTLANLLAFFSLLVATILIVILNSSRQLSHSKKREQSETVKRISAQNSLESRQFIIDQHAIVIITDSNRIITHANNKFCEISGYAKSELLGKNQSIFDSGNKDNDYWETLYRDIDNGQIWHGEIKNRTKDGEIYWVNSTIASMKNVDGKIEGYIAIHTDITQQKSIQEELEQHQNELEKLVQKRTAELELANEALKKLSEIDPLTQIANRRIYEKTLINEIATAKRSGQPLCFLMIDIDHFKEYNDNYGHDVGDAALKAIAQTIAHSLPRKTDLCARIGGEEFVVLMPATHSEGGFRVAENIRVNIKALAIKHEYSKVTNIMTVSVGVSSLEGDTLNEVDLFHNSDKALYKAKGAGRNRCMIYSETSAN